MSEDKERNCQLDLQCPNCQAVIKRKYGLPAILYTCKCGKDWILSLGNLVSREEFFTRADAEHGI